MKFDSNGKLICSCAVPVLNNKDMCTNCGRSLEPAKLTKLNASLDDLNGAQNNSECKKCSFKIDLMDKYCPNCGEKILLNERDAGLGTEANCKNCGASIVKHQKFCSSCGLFMNEDSVQPKSKVFGSSIQGAGVKKDSKKIGVIAITVVGFLLFLVLLGSTFQGQNQQDECFDREMTKFGAFADPKGWALQSRLYCQSLYP